MVIFRFRNNVCKETESCCLCVENINKSATQSSIITFVERKKNVTKVARVAGLTLANKNFHIYKKSRKNGACRQGFNCSFF